MMQKLSKLKYCIEDNIISYKNNRGSKLESLESIEQNRDEIRRYIFKMSKLRKSNYQALSRNHVSHDRVQSSKLELLGETNKECSKISNNSSISIAFKDANAKESQIIYKN